MITLQSRVDELTEQNKQLEQRLDYLLSLCFVTPYGEIALPTGRARVMTHIEKEDSIRFIDKAIKDKAGLTS